MCALALRRSITHPFVRKQELTVYTLNNELEKSADQRGESGATGRESDARQRAGRSEYAQPVPEYDATGERADESGGERPGAAGATAAAPLLARYARLFAPGLHVLSYNEVPDELELKIMGALM